MKNGSRPKAAPMEQAPGGRPALRDGRRYPKEKRVYFNWNRTVTVNTAGVATPLMSSGL